MKQKKLSSFLNCHIFCTSQDSFVVRMFDPHHSPMEIVSEVPLKLTRKCLDAFGMDLPGSSPEATPDRKTICELIGIL